jgi:Domain of unknown function (DUF1877)
MSIESIYYRVKSSKFGQIPESEEEIISLLDEIAENNDLVLDIGTYWHGVQFLITGNDSMPGEGNFTSLLGDIFSGGSRIPSEDYPTYVLSVANVNEITKALNDTSIEAFSERLDPIVFFDADLYPTKGWSQGDLEELIEIYNQLVDFFNLAAKEDEAIIVRYI